MPVRLHLTHIPELDTLVALEYGRIDEGVPERWWRRIGTEVGYLRDPKRGCDLGFKVRAFSRLDVDAFPELWQPPVFTVPMLGLGEASAGDVVLAARALFGTRPSISHEFFALAGEASGEEALALWLCCLEAGESMAHYGIGTTLYRLGRFREAYRHLRYYTEISPELAGSWCWYGRAAEALCLDGEAAGAYRRAVALERLGGPATGARELLDDLEAHFARLRRDRRPRRGRWPRR